MEHRSHALAAGAFVLLLGAALVAVVAWFQGDHVERVAYTVVARTGVPGLNIKAPVKLHGVQVGKVEEIAFDPAEPRQILVSIEVDKSAPLTASTFAQLGYQGITGLSFIDLSDADDAGAGSKPRAAGSRIELRPSLIDQLSSGGPRLLGSVNEAAQRLNRLLSDANQQQLSRTLVDLGQASAGVAQLAQDLRPAVAALRPLAQRSDRLLQDAGQTLSKIDGLASESTLLAQDLRQRAAALDRLGLAAAQLQTSTRRIELALVGPHRPRSQSLVDDLSQASRGVERAAGGFADLAEQPQGLLFGRAGLPPGPGEAGFEPNGKGR